MNDYQQKKMGKYVLPQTVYRQALWAVKDLERLKERKISLEEKAFSVDSISLDTYTGNGKTGMISDNTGRSATELALVTSRIRAIDKAFEMLPERFREGIRNKLLYNMDYPIFYSDTTWRRWQQVLIYNVAMNLQLY